MTTMIDRPRTRAPLAAFDPRSVRTSSIGPAPLLLGLDDKPGLGWAEHRRIHGDLPRPSRTELMSRLDGAGLTGRGGAGFPLADKIRALHAGQPVVVVNGAEGEPGSAKDAVLLGRVPHQVLDGAAIVAAAIGARHTIVAVTDPTVEQLIREAAGQRPDAAQFEIRRLPARFIAGEARTVVRTLNGGPQLPPGRRVHATEHGVDGRPSLLANAETFAHVAEQARRGAAEQARRGAAEQARSALVRAERGAETGTTLLSVTGAVARPGVVEVPIGLHLGELAAHVGAHPSPWVVIGGYHGAWLEAHPALALSRPALHAAGGTLGAGTVMFVGAETCPSAELSRVADWLAGESARQCGPCAFGLPSLATQLRALHQTDRAGDRPRDQARIQRQLDQLPGRGACSHPDGAARFLASGPNRIARDLHAHSQRDHQGRDYREEGHYDRGNLATDRAAAFTSADRA